MTPTPLLLNDSASSHEKPVKEGVVVEYAVEKVSSDKEGVVCVNRDAAAAIYSKDDDESGTMVPIQGDNRSVYALNIDVGSSEVGGADFPSGDNSTTFQVGSSQPTARKLHKIKREARLTINSRYVTHSSTISSVPIDLLAVKESSGKRKSDDMDIEMDDCDGEQKRSCMGCGVFSDIGSAQDVAGVGVDQPREKQ
ncbi:unnamed protein product [Amaranthus hypochondriacus]